MSCSELLFLRATLEAAKFEIFCLTNEKEICMKYIHTKKLKGKKSEKFKAWSDCFPPTQAREINCIKMKLFPYQSLTGFGAIFLENSGTPCSTACSYFDIKTLLGSRSHTRAQSAEN